MTGVISIINVATGEHSYGVLNYDCRENAILWCNIHSNESVVYYLAPDHIDFWRKFMNDSNDKAEIGVILSKQGDSPAP
jgi:hypothetical protein